MTSALANPTSDSLPDAPDRSGLPDEPRLSAGGVALGIGAVWGLLGYSVLWEGVPFAVQRPFVQSVLGTLALLPVRTVLWLIHRAELIADRTFDLSQNHWWIGALAGAIGAGIAVSVAWAGRAALRSRSRR
jgi:hypothetical protein